MKGENVMEKGKNNFSVDWKLLKEGKVKQAKLADWQWPQDVKHKAFNSLAPAMFKS